MDLCLSFWESLSPAFAMPRKFDIPTEFVVYIFRVTQSKLALVHLLSIRTNEPDFPHQQK